MSKALAYLKVVSLSGVMVFITFALIATLDEFARIPFYRTLPIAACFVNGATLFLLWHSKARLDIASRLWSRLDVRRTPLWGNRSNFTRDHSMEISAAVARIHSVAWRFPTRNGGAGVETQETRLT